jgi:hypothetical protein
MTAEKDESGKSETGKNKSDTRRYQFKSGSVSKCPKKSEYGKYKTRYVKAGKTTL